MRTRGEGGLEKIGGIWYFSYINLNGKQVAVEMLRKAKEELAKGIEPVDTKKLFYEDLRAILVADYVANGKAKMDGEDLVISGKKGVLKALDDFFGGMAVRTITTDAIRRFIAKRKEKDGVSGPACNRNLARLRRMFTLAKREGKVANIPYFPMGKESDPREGFVERLEFEKLRAEMPVNLHAALTFCYETGCRTGAMKQIVWPWVKLDKNEIHLPPQVIKNRKPLIVPLSKELAVMLKKLFRKDGPVFDTTNFRREWIKACVKLGLGKKTGEEWHQYEGLIPHDFRRLAARNLIQAGVDQSTAMRITGHRTVAVFQRYNIVSTEQLHEAMAKVSENATKTQIAISGSRNNS